jgi:hypothetical protein
MMDMDRFRELCESFAKSEMDDVCQNYPWSEDDPNEPQAFLDLLERLVVGPEHPTEGYWVRAERESTEERDAAVAQEFHTGERGWMFHEPTEPPQPTFREWSANPGASHTPPRQHAGWFTMEHPLAKGVVISFEVGTEPVEDWVIPLRGTAFFLAGLNEKYPAPEWGNVTWDAYGDPNTGEVTRVKLVEDGFRVDTFAMNPDDV